MLAYRGLYAKWLYEAIVDLKLHTFFSRQYRWIVSPTKP